MYVYPLDIYLQGSLAVACDQLLLSDRRIQVHSVWFEQLFYNSQTLSLHRCIIWFCIIIELAARKDKFPPIKANTSMTRTITFRLGYSMQS